MVWATGSLTLNQREIYRKRLAKEGDFVLVACIFFLSPGKEERCSGRTVGEKILKNAEAEVGLTESVEEQAADMDVTYSPSIVKEEIKLNENQHTGLKIGYTESLIVKVIHSERWCLNLVKEFRKLADMPVWQ